MGNSPVKNLDLKKLESWVEEFSKILSEKQILLLSGPMGAGKTQFVHFLLKYLEGEEPSSPTFAIHQSYSSIRGDIDHVDLYRLENEEDLESTGFWDLFEKESGLIIIEWADRLDEEKYPLYWDKIHLKIIESEEGLREISFEN